jgi:uncharacterized protein YkwD
MRLGLWLTCLLLGSACDDGSSSGLDATESELVSLINEERAERGLMKVSVRDDLVCAATHHAADIGDREECTHDGTDGSGPGDRVDACGGAGWSGEIVACGHTTPRGAVDGWLGSPGHHDIMLDEGQRQIGVAMVNHYWTAIFDRLGSRRGSAGRATTDLKCRLAPPIGIQ